MTRKSAASSLPRCNASNNRLTGVGVDYDDRGNLINWNGAVYEYDDFNQMKRMFSGAEDWIYTWEPRA